MKHSEFKTLEVARQVPHGRCPSREAALTDAMAASSRGGPKTPKFDSVCP